MKGNEKKISKGVEDADDDIEKYGRWRGAV